MNSNQISPITAGCNQMTTAFDKLTAAIRDKTAELVRMYAELAQLTEQSLDNLLQVVANVCGVTSDEVKGGSRVLKHVIPRQVFCYVANKCYDIPAASIAPVINRDRTTVIHSIHVISDLLEVKDPLMTDIINQITQLQ